ncbi:Cmk3 [uncultured Desulfobacterium sp.]|uniref:Cmk3 n=1 Tax=uncultured Desulfobacterium sp. TaxID=201089 RepID=A0A445N124_9BACT|nr:Cmk3 [uncultured Desulfobacterium sp.]
MKSIEQIIDDQVRKWELKRSEEGREKIMKPLITLSREPGSGGGIIGKTIAEQLVLDYFHNEIIQKMAESASISERLLKTLDEKGLSVLDDWISTLVNERHLWPDQYLRHLLKVVGAIGRHGGAVIVGRGASFILPPETNLRVRVVAPLETRVNNVVRDFGVSYDEAKRHVLKTESDRRAFVRKYFHEDIGAVVNYDLIINTGKLSISDAVEAIKGALKK